MLIMEFFFLYFSVRAGFCTGCLHIDQGGFFYVSIRTVFMLTKGAFLLKGLSSVAVLFCLRYNVYQVAGLQIQCFAAGGPPVICPAQALNTPRHNHERMHFPAGI
ncbi:MAG: hypothetical protein E7238_08450 [Sarcina sp.]|nr:hypothetical protein [Sarcina sp.]